MHYHTLTTHKYENNGKIIHVYYMEEFIARIYNHTKSIKYLIPSQLTIP